MRRRRWNTDVGLFQRWAAIAAGAAIAALTVAGCSGSGADSATVAQSMGGAAPAYSADGAAPADEPASEGMGDAGEMEQPRPVADADEAYSRADTDASGSSAAGAGAAPLPMDRQIIRTADVTVTISVPPDDDAVIEGFRDDHGDDDSRRIASDKALAAAAADGARAVRALATSPGGYVAGSDGRGASVTVTLRIPAGAYESVMGRLADIGEVTALSESTVDVTGEMIDVKSRIASQQASVDRLRALMAEASSMQDVIAIESELSRREADLESLQRRQSILSDQVALSTISVTVTAVPEREPVAPPEPEVERSAFMTGLLAGWHGITAVGRAAATVVGGLLPFLPVIAVLAAAAWFVVRRTRRTRSGTPLPATASAHSLDVGSDVHEVHEDADHRREPEQ